jgi:hypothetical protein
VRWTTINTRKTFEIPLLKPTFLQSLHCINYWQYVIAIDARVLTPSNKLFKFADDTYFIIREIKINSQSAEIDHIETWARTNNLTLNRKKSTEIIFVDTRRKRQDAAYPPLPGVLHVTSLQVLGVTVTNGLSASDYVRGVITNCSQTLYALRILRTNGMCDSALQTIFRSVVVAKLLYACSAWWGFINATDQQRVNAAKYSLRLLSV